MCIRDSYVTCAATTTDLTREEQQQPASEELETEQRLTPRDGEPRDYPNIDNERAIATHQEKSPEDSQTTYNDFVDNRLQFNVDAFQLAREHLGVDAERRKLDYDQHVKSKEFKAGDWIWYYYPRRYQKRSPKWSKTYDGPFLVIKRITPSDYVIQKSKLSLIHISEPTRPY